MSCLYECKDVCFAYEKNEILKNISLKIEEGDFVSIIGSNGSGKSTLIKLFIGSNKASKGKLKLYGDNIEGYHEWGRLAYVSQIGFQEGVNFPATAKEIIKLGLYSKKKKTQQETEALILEYATFVGMEQNLNEAFSKMSGGQKQRVLIAKALIAQPKVLILDEPTSSVDNESILVLLRVLKHFNEVHDMSVIVATHDERMIESSNRVFHIEHGSLVEGV